MKNINGFFIVVLTGLVISSCLSCNNPDEGIRTTSSLNSGWKTIANDTSQSLYDGFEQPGFDDSDWETVRVPHNWDKYHGYLRKVHGNRHGNAWYRKEIHISGHGERKRYFLFFEGVGSYATVWVNGKLAGRHAGGRTTFTLDITNYVVQDSINLIAVKAGHPAQIRDLPWVCGGCSTEVGFSEGSQPMGIHRPVSLIVTNDVRIEPFGIHIWNDNKICEQEADVYYTTEIRNYSSSEQAISVHQNLKDPNGKVVAQSKMKITLAPGETKITNPQSFLVRSPRLWSPSSPTLYTLETSVIRGGETIDHLKTPYGIRWISWPVSRNDSTGQFLLNGKPVFINGVGEYEHMFGNSHAFTDKQIEARVSQIKAAGFNAFRDAHQPHNLRYQQHFDKEGILWWTQLSAHIWFDNPDFKENFKTLLREWVKERRNNPSNIVWGLQNESTLPAEFAEECVRIIREMDPTTSSQRIVTTCNGGSGTDWNVVQNWSGTYGGDPGNYANELPEQLLNGEYGAWRSLGLHTEGPYNQKGILSEDRMAQLLQMKLRLAESVSDRVCGQFLWIFSSHDNPGRIQSGEAFRDIDRLGPINYKGLFTPWAEPADAFYMYRSHYAPKDTEPMVYIVSHTWPNRWKTPGIKDSITVYSNCDEVELLNDYNNSSLGRLKHRGIGHPFVWEDIEIKYNVLQAKGYVNGKLVAEDLIVLDHLPESPKYNTLSEATDILEADKEFNYLYRVNCGGPEYRDSHGKLWHADMHLQDEKHFGSRSWTDNFKAIPNFYGSQRRTFDPIGNTIDWPLFQNFRYGLEDLSFQFPAEPGEYRVELYFTEPWYGTGGGLNCKDWRNFDIAINDSTVLKGFDIWSETGHDKAIKKVFRIKTKDSILKVHFPNTPSGQAIISAIAIASADNNIKPAPQSGSIIEEFLVYNHNIADQVKLNTWLDIGDKQYTDTETQFYSLPSNLFGAIWINTPKVIQELKALGKFRVNHDADVFIAFDKRIAKLPGWIDDYSNTGISLENGLPDGCNYILYSKRFQKGETVILGENGFIGPEPANMYTSFVLPASKLDAPTDQRKATYYSSTGARIKGPVKRKAEGTRHYLQITNNNTVEIEWDFYIGLASTYGVHFKFQNNTGDAVKALMTIETATGILMHEETIEMYHKPGKWRTVKTNTGSTINAGNYKVKLKIKDAGNLLIQRMEIQ